MGAERLLGPELRRGAPIQLHQPLARAGRAWGPGPARLPQAGRLGGTRGRDGQPLPSHGGSICRHPGLSSPRCLHFTRAGKLTTWGCSRLGRAPSLRLPPRWLIPAHPEGGQGRRPDPGGQPAPRRHRAWRPRSRRPRSRRPPCIPRPQRLTASLCPRPVPTRLDSVSSPLPDSARKPLNPQSAVGR